MTVINNTAMNTSKDAAYGDDSFFMKGVGLALCGEQFDFKPTGTHICPFIQFHGHEKVRGI